MKTKLLTSEQIDDEVKRLKKEKWLKRKKKFDKFAARLEKWTKDASELSRKL